MKCFLDTETCGLHGMAVIIQYAFDDGPINIHNFWTSTIDESLELIAKIADCDVVGFNLAFDWFHICKMYTTLTLAKQQLGGHEYPDEHVDTIAILEERARDGDCVKPKRSCDLMLHARRTEFQITMERGDIRIRRVPTSLAFKLAEELETRVTLDPILFARRKKTLAPRWVVHDVVRDGVVSRDFKDIVLKFKPSMALKALAVHVLGVKAEDVITFGSVDVPEHYRPYETGYAPYALAHTTATEGPKRKWKVKHPKQKTKKVNLWPAVIEAHINHWGYNNRAREYAAKDVEYTRALYKYFKEPEPGDDDSELATMVGAVRWRGYAIDVPGIRELRDAAIKRIKEVPTDPRRAKAYIGEVLSPEERAVFTSTGKVILEKMASLVNGEPCCFGPCEHCNMTGMLPAPKSAKRAADVLEARKMKKEVELYDKLLLAGRFHASFKVIGALSGRMAGADKLNPQGIKRTKEVRGKFPLAFGHLRLRGGDFEGFEVTLAEAAYGDADLRKDLQTCENCRDIQVVGLPEPVVARDWLSADALATYTKIQQKIDTKKLFKAEEEFAKKGTPVTFECRSVEQIQNTKLKTFACPKCGCKDRMKIHALFGTFVYPPMTYDDIKATSGQPDDKYNKSKSAVFAKIYGGEAYTLMTRLGVPIEVAEAASNEFAKRYPGVGLAQVRVANAFCSIRQEAGPGSKIVYAPAQEYVESLLGFKRYFILENRIVESIFALAEKPPDEWKALKIKVRRRDREQSASGALQSALFGTAFQIQAGNKRAAANHEIQSTGAQITKFVQRKIWDHQPHGINKWLVQPCNVHDEILCPTAPEVDEAVAKTVMDAVESFRGRVPLIEFDWKAMKSWAEK